MFADKFFPPIFRSDFAPSKLSRYGRRTRGAGVQNEAWGRFDFGNQNEPETFLPNSRSFQVAISMLRFTFLSDSSFTGGGVTDAPTPPTPPTLFGGGAVLG